MAAPAADVEALDKEADMLGISKTLIPEQKYFEIWPKNIEAFQFFQKLQTQWRYFSMGGVAGLDYSSVIPVLDMFCKKHKKRIFNDIQAIEVGYLKAANKKDGK